MSDRLIVITANELSPVCLRASSSILAGILSGGRLFVAQLQQQLQVVWPAGLLERDLRELGCRFASDWFGMVGNSTCATVGRGNKWSSFVKGALAGQKQNARNELALSMGDEK